MEINGIKRERFLVNVFCVMSIIMFVVLLGFSFLLSWENREFWNEFVYMQFDSVVANAVGVLIALVFLGGMLKLYDIFMKKVNMTWVAIVLSAICTAISFWWVTVSMTKPQADQGQIVDFAAAFENGNTSGLGNGEYLGYYRHQLGLITIIRIIYKICGVQDYRCFQYFSALMVFVLVFSGYQVIKKLTNDSGKAELIYLILALLCVPMYGYVPFVYGEICSTAGVVLGTWILLSCLDKFQWWKLLLLAAVVGFSVQARQNTLVPMIGFLIVIMVKMINKPDWKLVSIGGAVIGGVFMSQVMVNAIYAPYVPEGSEPVPSLLYIAMGSHDQIEGAPGWHDEYDKEKYKEMNYNPEAASAVAREELKQFMTKCVNDPGYALDFYTEKMNIQWNAPMYLCIVSNNNFAGEWTPLIESVYEGDAWNYLGKFMNIYQLIVYGGVLALLLIKRKEWNSIEKYILLIGVFGGFLFSMIWEAKTRYVFPYLIMMLPYVAIGVECFLNVLAKRMIRTHIESPKKEQK